MKKIFIICGFFLFPILLHSQDQKEPIIIDSVIVAGNRASRKTPVTYTNISKEVIERSAPNISVPLLLNLQPSVVATTESGVGLGPTKLSVRGSDPTRINVTINGISMNNPESQEAFFVNVPAIAGFLQSVQLQRGIGTSMDGAGSFGASINMHTNYVAPNPYGNAEIGYGSFNTFTSAIGAGSGLLASGLSFDFRYSHSSTDGYIRNGKGDFNSLFASIGYKNGNNAFKLNYIMGSQHTGITWEGVSKEMLEEDRTFNPAGMYYDDAGNVKYYDNETDNYIQHYVQLFYSHQFDSGLLWVNTLNLTKGDGYYENYKYDSKFSKYGFADQTIDGVLYDKSDFIIQQSMDNAYYVASSNLKYNSSRLRAAAGVTYSFYNGLHFGDVLWSKYYKNISTNDYDWYTNQGDKWEMTAFARAEYDISDFTVFADVQYRHIGLDMSGPDKDFASLDYKTSWDFFNPKLGVSYGYDDNNFYASFAMGHKEPSRSDIKEAIKADRAEQIKPEMMMDYEIGYRLTKEKISLEANLYFMEYRDQLVATGKLSDTGYEIKDNVPISYRRGLELSLGWQIMDVLRFDANTTLSVNKIKQYTAWVDTFDNNVDWTPLPQTPEYYDDTYLNMSPSVIGMAMLTLEPISGLYFGVNGKYVGRQYYDNTSSIDRSLPAYFVMGASASYKIKAITFSAYVDNILNNKYVSNAWVYRAIFANGDASYVSEGFYPQATTNFMFKVAMSF